MSRFMRHIGRTVNTDRRLVVVFMQIPGREDHALVVDTDAIHDRYHDDLMKVVEHEGQSEIVLGNILTRRTSSVSGQDILTTLHSAGLLHAIPVSSIVMCPEPNRRVPLTEIIDAMNRAKNPNAATNSANELEAAQTRQNRIIENQDISTAESKTSLARNILIEAELLETEAKSKRERAYALSPNLEKKSSLVPVDITGLTETQVKEALDRLRTEIANAGSTETVETTKKRSSKKTV